MIDSELVIKEKVEIVSIYGIEKLTLKFQTY